MKPRWKWRGRGRGLTSLFYSLEDFMMIGKVGIDLAQDTYPSAS